MSTPKIRAIPLGGLGEIGAMNMMVYEFRRALLVVDCGLMFPESDMPGVDIVIPDIEFLIRRAKDIRAIFLTHGHEDHLGALPYVLRQISPPVYLPPFPAAIAREKLAESDLVDKPDLRVYRIGEEIDLDPFFVDTIHVTHSIPDACALAIRTAAGVVIHTGDFKLDPTPIDGRPTDVDKLEHYGREGVLALLSDSTNAEREGMTPSELSVRETLFRHIAEAPGRVIVSGFSTNIHRNQQIIDACVASNRRLCILGRSMEQKFRIARELGYLQGDDGRFVTLEELAYLPDREVALLTTGSQGEPFSVLTRMAMGSFKGFEILPEDTVILSSKFIPGNERAISNLLNGLLRRGAHVIHEKNAHIHVSGHAYRGDLRKMIELTRPRHFMPIHGEMRQLDAHRRLAIECGVAPERTMIIEDGATALIGRDGISLGPPVETGRVFVDGKGVGDVGPTILRDRMHLGQGGMVIAVLAVSKQSGEIVEGPDLLTRGFVLEEKSGALMDLARKCVVEAYEALSTDEKADLTEVETQITRALRRCFGTTLERRPMIIPVVLEM